MIGFSTDSDLVGKHWSKSSDGDDERRSDDSDEDERKSSTSANRPITTMSADLVTATRTSVNRPMTMTTIVSQTTMIVVRLIAMTKSEVRPTNPTRTSALGPVTMTMMNCCFKV